MNKIPQKIRPDTISINFLQYFTTAPSAQYSHGPCSPAETPPLLRQFLSGLLLYLTILINLQPLAKKLPPKRKTTMQKLVIAGLGLAFLGFIIASTTEYTFVAGIVFVGIVILGIIGIMKMRKPL